ncbi:putative HAD superfamily hydrolase [Helicobacter cinaedi PAGU611]|uniref:HD domain-containing protein n=5 Tax=Helicobacter cinaedi TaxID=213 RepID=UPI00025D3575|nr:HD domain-containing protein [Helicobacter cinaedi]AWK61537.1 HD domain-containing protein [Helicobacter cinaedi]QOQ95643.1 HD domain-containing protein [Helicobacter cinaedi]BAM11966.1 putative HAD superfamily hydrolase [Helicobacter cinaedi PAGU611]BBB19564.1 competence protein ComGF [Helicobacter cinaedi]
MSCDMPKPPRLSPELLKKIFVAASIRRWNDHATPVEFVELDKQAHKIVIAYLLAKYEEYVRGVRIDWEALILQFCFEFFERIVLTDIKPPVFHKLQAHHNKELVNFVCNQLESELGMYEFFPQMREYLTSNKSNIEGQILKASHYYASKWEFDIIYHFNPYMYDVQNIRNIINKQVEEHYHLAGMQQIMLYENVRELVTMFGQLRFQKRWSQTPRIPATSVLGHTLIVALSAYLVSFDIGCCKQMRINHFLCGLFHDLPEILTRDIISPIKRSVKGLDEFIKKIEEEAVNEKILAIVPPNIQEDISYFTQNEFSNRYKIEHFCYTADSESLMQTYNRDEFNGVYGEFLKIFDNLSAYLEAKISISHGISSDDLVNGAKGIYDRCADKVICGVDVGKLFRDFA